MVLLIIDAQTAITTEKLFCFQSFVQNVRMLIETARENQIEVIFVRHEDGPGGELEKGTKGFEIYDAFRPEEGELIFDKRVNSPFRDSGLLAYLREKQEKNIMLAGLQTDYCMDAAVKCGFEHGFHMIVPEGANTTVDNQFMTAKQSCGYYNGFLWKNRYAQCIAMKEAAERLKTESREAAEL